MNDPRFARIVICIETPKGKTDEWDKMNLAVLKELVREKESVKHDRGKISPFGRNDITFKFATNSLAV